MQDIYKKLFNAKYVVIATPVFFMGVPSRLKAIIDRCQAVWAKKYVLKEKISSIDNRKGFLVSVSGLKNKKDVFTGTINTIKAFFHVLEIEYSGNLLCNGFDSTEKLAKESKLLENIRKAGKEFIRSV